MAPPTMKLANRSKVYTSMSTVFDNRENCKQCQPSLNGLVSTSVLCHLLVILKVIFANSVDPDQTDPLGAD